MPNWCENNVMIHHKKEDKVNAIAEECKKDNPRLFNFIKPEPDWLTTPNDKGQLPKLKDIKNSEGELVMQVKKFPDGTVDERWYDWRCDNWGTKWDIREFTDHEFIVDKQGSEYCLELSFWTAWAPPVYIYQTLFERGFGISADYIERGVGYVGTWINGQDSEYKFDDKSMPKKLKRMVEAFGYY